MKLFFSILFCSFLFGTESIYLNTPDLSQENIIEARVGIRPYRKSGVRIEAEALQNKWIIHNYGYGGSGLTLCFGGAKEVTNILSTLNSSSRTVAILGAGVAGLSVAYDLLEQGYEVRIYSDEWSPHLTSNVAAGIWSPPDLLKDVSEEKKQLYQQMLKNSEIRFLNSTKDHPEFKGVHFIDYYDFNPTSLKEEVIVHFDNGVVKKGRKKCVLGIDGKLFVEDLFSKVKTKGANLVQCYFKDLNDILNLKEEIIINCTSIGSRRLFNDQEFIPIRGHLIHFFPKEGVNFIFHQKLSNSTSSWVTLYPWCDRLILGGIYEYGEEDLVVVPEVVDEMIKKARKCLSN